MQTVAHVTTRKGPARLMLGRYAASGAPALMVCTDDPVGDLLGWLSQDLPAAASKQLRPGEFFANLGHDEGLTDELLPTEAIRWTGIFLIHANRRIPIYTLNGALLERVVSCLPADVN